MVKHTNYRSPYDAILSTPCYFPTFYPPRVISKHFIHPVLFPNILSTPVLFPNFYPLTCYLPTFYPPPCYFPTFYPPLFYFPTFYPSPCYFPTFFSAPSGSLVPLRHFLTFRDGKALVQPTSLAKTPFRTLVTACFIQTTD